MCQEIAQPSGTLRALHQMSYPRFLFYVTECVFELCLLFQEKHLEKEKENKVLGWQIEAEKCGMACPDRQSRWNRGWVSRCVNHCYPVACRVGFCIVFEHEYCVRVFCSWFSHCCSRVAPSLKISFTLIVIVVFVSFLFVVLWMYIMVSNLLGMRQDNINRTHNWNHMQLRLILSPRK